MHPTNKPEEHPPFAQKPEYKKLSSQSEQLTSLARAARQHGFYNLSTLYLFKKAYVLSRRPRQLLQHALFARDLGYPLSPLRFRRLKALQQTSQLYKFRHGIRRHAQRQLNNLIAEYEQRPAPAAVDKAYKRQIAVWRQHSEQTAAELIEQLRTQSLAIVGNSPTLKGEQQGPQIDNHDYVLRFNHYQSEHTTPQDIGRKVHIWCMAPGVDMTAPDDAQYVLIAGPDMLWQQQQFPQLRHYQGKVLSVPLVYWRHLVRQFAAPPSAGALAGAYFSMQVPKNSLNLYGFSFAPPKQEQYHHADPLHKAVTRHNWTAEAKWMQQFKP